MKLYSKKVLVAWGEAISGNTEIRDWLLKNNYPELALFCYALYFDEKSSNWLFKNHPHLLALIKAVEGNNNARIFLNKKFPQLYTISLAADGDVVKMNYLIKNDPLFAVIANKIKLVKDDIDEINNDIHKWGFS